MPLKIALENLETIDPRTAVIVDTLATTIQRWANNEMGGAGWKYFDIRSGEIAVRMLGAGNSFSMDPRSSFIKWLRSGPTIDLQFLLSGTVTGGNLHLILDLPSDWLLVQPLQMATIIDTGTLRAGVLSLYQAGYGTQPRQRPTLTVERLDGVNLAGAVAAWGQVRFEISAIGGGQ